MANVIIKTKGMHCASCEMLIVDSLEENEGVKNAKADHKNGIIEIDYDESRTDLNIIKEIINKEGFKVE